MLRSEGNKKYRLKNQIKKASVFTLGIFTKLKRKIVGKKAHYLKELFCNKRFYLFLIIFIIGNIILYSITYHDQKSLALNEPTVGSDIYIPGVVPETLLSELFYSEPHSSTLGSLLCNLLFLGLMLGTELFILISTIVTWKRFPKIYLILYFVVLQPFVITPVFVFLSVSEQVVSNLNKQAKIDVDKQIALLSSDGGLEQLLITFSPIEIKNKITQSSEPPKIVDEQVDDQAVIQSLQIQKKDTLYRAVIIPKYLLDQDDFSIDFNALLFPNNVLILKKTTKDLLSNILPILSSKILYREIEKSLLNKKEPLFEVLSEDAYNLVQERKIEERKIKFINYINELKSSIADANKYIPLYQSDIESLENDKANYKNRTDGTIDGCEARYSAEDCNWFKGVVNANIASYDNDIRSLKDGLQAWIDAKPNFTYNLQQVTISYEKFLKFPITPELQAGVFNFPDQIYIKYYPINDIDSSPSNYIGASLHEYLHYKAFKSIEYLPVFMDEGMTDYLATNLLSVYFSNKDIALHYPEEVSIIQELIRNIPEEDLVKAYFSQSEKEFEKLFDKYYMKGTYKKFTSMGENLTYLDAYDFEGREKASEEIIQLLVSSKKNEI